LLLSSVSFVLNGQFYLGLFSLSLFIVAMIPWILFFSSNLFIGVAIPEAISGLGISFWIFVLGLKMLYD